MIVTAYWDTTDLRLLGWGHTLAHRSGTGADDGWVVNLAGRGERRYGGPPEQPPAEALTLIRAFDRYQPVASVATVHDDADSPVASPTRSPADDLRAALGAWTRALPEVTTPAVGPHSTIAAVVRAAIASGVVRLLECDPGVRLGDDPEDVHQARVATRRLRDDLRTLAPLVDQRWAAVTRKELSWLGTCLGRVRDIDVLGARVRDVFDGFDHADADADADADAAAGLLALADRDRDDARATLLAALGSDRYLDLLERLVAATLDPPLGAGVKGRRPAAPEVADLADEATRRLDRSVRRLRKKPRDAELHTVRRRAKHARYATELRALTTAKKKKIRTVSRRAAGYAHLQDVLGTLQDSVVVTAWTRAALARVENPAQGFVLGRIHEVERARSLRARAEWRYIYDVIRD